VAEYDHLPLTWHIALTTVYALTCYTVIDTYFRGSGYLGVPYITVKRFHTIPRDSNPSEHLCLTCTSAVNLAAEIGKFINNIDCVAGYMDGIRY